jgi:hypothetical protein
MSRPHMPRLDEPTPAVRWWNSVKSNHRPTTRPYSLENSDGEKWMSHHLLPGGLVLM